MAYLLPLLKRTPLNIAPLVCPLFQLRFMSSPKPRTISRPKDKMDRMKKLRDLKRTKLDEYKRLMQEESKRVHCMKIAFKGEALDPEALNPDRKRPPVEKTEEELEEEALTLKAWSKYGHKQKAKMVKQLTELKDSRIRAMRELKKASLFHYNECLKEEMELPIEKAPIPEFPPIPGYEPPEPYDQLFPEEKKKQKK